MAIYELYLFTIVFKVCFGNICHDVNKYMGMGNVKEFYCLACGFATSFQTRQREYDSSGSLKNASSILKENGFHVGQYVVRRKDKVIAQIHDLEGEKVTLNVEEGPISGWAQVSIASFVEKKEWKPMSKNPITPEEVKNWTSFTAQNNRDLMVHLAKGRIFEALLKLEKEHMSSYSGLQIFGKPQRSVVATSKFEKHKLILVPTTLRIEIKNAGDAEKDSGNNVCVGRAGVSDMSFFLCPCFNVPVAKEEGGKEVGFISPYWCVRSTRDEKEANCEKTGVFKPTDLNSNIKIHTIRNSKVINPGDSLLLYVPKTVNAEETEPLTPVVTEPEPKRRRTTKGK